MQKIYEAIRWFYEDWLMNYEEDLYKSVYFKYLKRAGLIEMKHPLKLGNRFFIALSPINYAGCFTIYKLVYRFQKPINQFIKNHLYGKKLHDIQKIIDG